MTSEGSGQYSHTATAPPLPPRASRSSLLPPVDPEKDSKHPYSSGNFPSHDPRTSSQQSLLPEYSRQDERRTLLLIYIHGFMGAETSFKSFPAHVHNLLTITLVDSHTVHSKIYPRYKTRQKIIVATDDFSRWYDTELDRLTECLIDTTQACSTRVADYGCCSSRSFYGWSASF